MPRFSRRSRSKLETCDPRLQALFNEVIKYYDCKIWVGHRGEADQNRAFRKKKSKLQWPNSKHNSWPSRAVDVAPYPTDWVDRKRFYHFAGFVTATAIRMGIRIRWGGDWDRDFDLNDQTFMDLLHFELV